MKCLRCKEEMKKVKMVSDVSGMAPYLAYKEKGLFNAQTRSPIECYVCPKCGYIELTAENPSVFHI